MHVSLDSALGRQRRLNSVGESVLQIAPSAAAAYSLRSLTGGDPKVVRVRRGSDNHEQDFTASEVSSGALTSFVNAQVVAPLDIQALTATGRDGDFLIAKAAYSLRSLGTRQATLAATGDTVARADGKFVVQVRRSSDDALKSFTADEVTDGTLLSFANPTYTVGTSVESASKPFDSFTSNGNDGFTATNDSTGTAKAGFPYTFATGDVISVSFDLIIADGASPTFILSGNNMGTGSLASGTTFTSSGSYTQEVTSGSGTGTHIAFSDGNAGTFTISNFKVTSHKADGFVKTWYDQSVTTQAGDTATGNHAVQGTAGSQPKIVNAGSLLNELDFDGTDDALDIDFGADLSQANTLFMVHQADSTSSSANEFFDRSSSSGDRTLLDQAGSDYRMLSPSSAGTGIAVTTDRTLVFSLYNGASSLLAKNGTLSSAVNPGTQGVNQNSSLGSSAGGTRFYNGSMQEFIIYNSDQTDNRVAIEANLGEVYGIDLPSGVDPGFDQVDGFVETWYDQSGNGRDSTNTTAAQQPIIVEAGVFQDGLKFTHTDTTNGKRLFVPRTAAELGQAFALVWVGKVTESDTSFNNLLGGLRGVQSYATGNTGIAIKSSDGTVAFINEDTTTSRVKSDSSTTATLNEDFVAFATYEDQESGPELSFQVDAGHQFFSFGSGYVTTATKDIGIMNATANSGTYRTQESPTGICREVLVYDTNQGDNRVALVTNINNQYNLF